MASCGGGHRNLCGDELWLCRSLRYVGIRNMLLSIIDRRLMTGAFILSALTSACGDIGALEVDVLFDSEEAELRTRALRLVVREVPRDGAPGCDALWAAPQPGLSQTEAVVSFPNRNDVLAAAVSIDYEALTLLVYGHPGIRTITSENPSSGQTDLEFEAVGDPIVGGCVDQPIEDPDTTGRLEISLFPAP